MCGQFDDHLCKGSRVPFERIGKIDPLLTETAASVAFLPVTVENQSSALQTDRDALEFPHKGPGFDYVPALAGGASSFTFFQSNVEEGLTASELSAKQPVVRKPETVVQKTCRRHGAPSSFIEFSSLRNGYSIGDDFSIKTPYPCCPV